MDGHYDDGGYNNYDNYDNTYGETSDGYVNVQIFPILVIFFSWFIFNCFCRILANNAENEINEPILKIKVKKLIKYNESFLEKSCPICLEEYQKNQKLIQLICNHYYHQECIRGWISTEKKSCPLCRSNLL